MNRINSLQILKSRPARRKVASAATEANQPTRAAGRAVNRSLVGKQGRIYRCQAYRCFEASELHSSRRLTLAKEFRVELCAPFGLPEPRVQQPSLPLFVATELHSSSRLTLAKEFRVEPCCREPRGAATSAVAKSTAVSWQPNCIISWLGLISIILATNTQG